VETTADRTPHSSREATSPSANQETNQDLEATTLETEADYLWGRREDLLLRVVSNSLYQQERWRILERRDIVGRALSALAGTSAMITLSQLGGSFTDLIKYATAVATCAGIASIVLQWGSRSRDAAKKKTEWDLLHKEIELTGPRDFLESHLNAWSARAIEIESNEPSPHPALFDRCVLRANHILDMRPNVNLSAWNLYRPVIWLP
jgi:hypothetical protein